MDKGSKNGATKVVAGTPDKGNKWIVKVSNTPISIPRVGDQAPTGEGVTNPYVSGDNIFGSDAERNRYIGVYEVDANNRIVKFQLLLVTPEKIQQVEGVLIDLILNGVRQKDTAILDQSASTAQANARIIVDNDAILELLSDAPAGSVLTVPEIADLAIVNAVVNGELLDRMIQLEGVFRIESGLGAYTVPAAAIDLSTLGNPDDPSDRFVTFSIALADSADAAHMNKLATADQMILTGTPVRFLIAAERNGAVVEVERFNRYVQREIRLPSDVPSEVTTSLSVDKNGKLLHMPTRIEAREGERYAVINSMYNGDFALIGKQVAFEDAKGHWAAAAIESMAARNIVVGTTKDKFEPNRSITRAEFITMLVRSLGLKNGAGEEKSFSDVYPNDWYDDSISAAVKFGLVTGYATGEFKPTNRISREESLTILSRAMALTGLHEEVQSSAADTLLAAFADGNDVAQWARQGMAAAIDAGIVQGRETKELAPKTLITRAEAATIIERLLRVSKLI